MYFFLLNTIELKKVTQQKIKYKFYIYTHHKKPIEHTTHTHRRTAQT